MNNIGRLKLETKGIELQESELSIYLLESNLQPNDQYNPQDSTNKKQILSSALSILESIANNPENMKNIKHEDMSISNFADSIQSRIDQLERKIRKLQVDEEKENESNFFMLFDR